MEAVKKAQKRCLRQKQKIFGHEHLWKDWVNHRQGRSLNKRWKLAYHTIQKKKKFYQTKCFKNVF